MHGRWRTERARRAGERLARAVVPLGTITLLLQVYFRATSLEVLGDLMLILGAVLSLHLTRARNPTRNFVWLPLYIGYLVCIQPCLWASGGVCSPWIGIFLSVLIVLGYIIQTDVGPLYNLALALTLLMIWIPITQQFGLTPRAVESTLYLGLILLVCVMALGYGLYELLRTEEDLVCEFSREENANRAKSAFIANVSHELRTPLGAILGFAELLRDEGVGAEDKQNFAMTIERNARQLNRLVDDLLDLSKAESGRLEIERQPLRIRELLAAVEGLMAPLVSKAGLSLSAKVDDAVPETVRTDSTRLKQILVNVVGNAIKFTARGSVLLAVGYVPAEYGQVGTLWIRVRDTGRGIAPEVRPKLFKPFSQADASTTRQFGGTGLGLNLSRELARLLGGTLNLTWTEVGLGSEFTLALPMEIVVQPTHSPPPTSTFANA